MFKDGTQFARLGGDEFLIVADCSHELSALVTDVKRCLAKPLEINGINVTVGASVGSARYDDGSTSAGDLLRQADREMYLDKLREKKKRTAASRVSLNRVTQVSSEPAHKQKSSPYGGVKVMFRI